MVKENNTEVRTTALKFAYDALSNKIFNKLSEVDLNDVKELFEFAEYNCRFINNEDLNIKYTSKSEKIRDKIRDITHQSK